MYRIVALLMLITGVLTSCGVINDEQESETPAQPKLADEVTLYYWDGGIPQEILDTFTQEYGVIVHAESFLTMEEGVANIRAGKHYDVVLMTNAYVGAMIAEELLAELDYVNIPNVKNLAANFRDMNFDPGNEHGFTFDWGTTGILARQDHLAKPVTSWRDLWNPAYSGKVGLWADPRTVIGFALMSLGYSINSDGTILIAFGWAYDALQGSELNPDVVYAIPEEGTLLWSEYAVIPANSPNQYTAEVFLSFLLRPEISAMFSNLTNYATTNEAAKSFIDESVLNNPVIFPTNEMLENAEIIMPLSSAGQAQYDAIWQAFVEGKEE